MLKEKSEKDKTIQAMDHVIKEMADHKINKENTIFIVSHDLLGIDEARYEVVEMTTIKQEPQFKILEVFDNRDAAQLCRDVLVDLLYEHLIPKLKGK